LTFYRLIKQSLQNAQVTADILDMEIFRFKDYGKEFIKRQHMSPDAYVQVALQVTYYRYVMRVVLDILKSFHYCYTRTLF